MDHFLGFYLTALGNHLRSKTNDALTPLGLDTRKLGVLNLLRHEPQLSQRQVADRLRMDRTTTMAIVESMGDQGWLRREKGEDARKNLLSLTLKGEEVGQEASRNAKRVETATLRSLSRQESNRLLDLLQRVTLDLANGERQRV